MARRVVKKGDRAYRKAYKLKDWCLKPKSRRDVYFRFCGHILQTFADLEDAEPLTDDAVVGFLSGAVMRDGSFESHVYGIGDDAELAKDGEWESLYRAGGAVMFHEYLVAVENGEWPEEEGE